MLQCFERSGRVIRQIVHMPKPGSMSTSGESPNSEMNSGWWKITLQSFGTDPLIKMSSSGWLSNCTRSGLWTSVTAYLMWSARAATLRVRAMTAWGRSKAMAGLRSCHAILAPMETRQAPSSVSNTAMSSCVLMICCGATILPTTSRTHFEMKHHAVVGCNGRVDWTCTQVRCCQTQEGEAACTFEWDELDAWKK